MQQTENNNQHVMDTSENIIKRLEELNKWQEGQKKLLQERQNMQRKMLGLEQRNMYKVLGLLHHEDNDMPAININKIEYEAAKETTKEMASTHPEASRDKLNDMDDKTCPLASNRSSGYATEELNNAVVTQQKRTFLKRGEGLKQRFKIDPETLRLNNLPRYKYANAHPNLKMLPNKKAYKNVPAAQKVEKEDPSAVTTELDAQEKRFQQLLITSKTVCNSTPEMKLSYCSSTSLQSDPKVRFIKVDELKGEDASHTTAQQQLGNLAPNSSCSQLQPTILWSNVLDSQHIKPMAVQDIRAQTMKNDAALANRLEEDEESENLSIFQLLEQKANEGSIDMNASYIKRFMQRKLCIEESDQDEIPVHEQLKELGLKPLAKEVLNDDDNETSAIDYTDGETDELTQSNTAKNYECLDSTKSTPARVVRTQVRVRFSDENDTCEYVEEENTSETSTLAANDSMKSEQLFQQFKDALLLALQAKTLEEQNGTKSSICQSDNSTLTEPHVTTSTDVLIPFVPSTTSQPLQLNEDLTEKANLIKTRLAELEKEIASFKENNLQLIKSKQEHELEKAHFAQEHLEAKERLNDEKIQMEIYLHDERMKIEDDKRKFEQQMRTTTANSKERKEIARLKQELQELQLQLRQKEQAHAAAQARLRVQIKNMEKDQKQLHEDIERLGKENKKLQIEKVQLERESNNKMLQEINRNIAKLTPKLQPPVVDQHDNVMRCTKPISTKASYSKTANRKSMKSLPIQNGTIKRCNATKNQLISNSISSDSEEAISYQKHNTSDENDHKDNNNDSEDDDILKELKKHNSCKSVKELNAEHKENNYVQNDPKATGNSNEFKREIINEDGSKDILYPNGNLKKISADGMNIRMLYFNKDIKETNINEGTIKYYYAETNTWHTTYLDGLEILEFPNGQTEHRHKNGIVEIHFPNNSIKIINPADEQKQEEWRFSDGTNVIQMRNGDKILMLPNGQKEIHTKLNKRREYPDGTVKLVYPDGSQETRYSNGRLRLKDKDGNLVMDTENVKY